MSRTNAKPRPVVVFSGHMIDAPDRREPRFPTAKEPAVRRAMAGQLDQWKIGPGGLGLCGGACGGDLIFAERCLERGSRVRLLLASPAEDFLRSSVRPGGSEWEARFAAVQRHPLCETLVRQDARADEGDAKYEAVNHWLMETAAKEAEPDSPYVLVLWDEKPAGTKKGGTSHFISLAGDPRRVAVINPLKL